MVKLTNKQREGLQILVDHKFILLYGGARSGKTFLTTYYVISRALKYPKSRHLICRSVESDARSSLWEQTIPDVLNLMGLEYDKHYTTTDKPMRVHLKNGAVIYVAGLDNGGDSRSDKILGREYMTIYANEVSDFKYFIFQKLRTRLSQKIENGKNKLILDLNPTGDSHFTHKIWIDNIEPQTLTKINNPNEYGYLQLNPYDNIDNLGDNYIADNLETLSGDARERFLYGNYQSTSDLLVLHNRPDNLFIWSDFEKWYKGREDSLKIVGGMDLGASDADAIAFIAYIKTDPTLWLIYEYKAFREDIGDLAKGLRDGFDFIKTKLPFFANPTNIKIYSDTSVIRHGPEGDKKKSYNELNRLYGFNISAAYKRDKSIRLDLLRGEYNTGNIKVQDSGYLFEEANQTVWTKNVLDGSIQHIINDDLYHPDMLFATLYAFNYLASYGSDALIKKLEVVSKKPAQTNNNAINTFEAVTKEQEKLHKNMDKINEVFQLIDDDSNYF